MKYVLLILLTLMSCGHLRDEYCHAGKVYKRTVDGFKYAYKVAQCLNPEWNINLK